MSCLLLKRYEPEVKRPKRRATHPLKSGKPRPGSLVKPRPSPRAPPPPTAVSTREHVFAQRHSDVITTIERYGSVANTTTSSTVHPANAAANENATRVNIVWTSPKNSTHSCHGTSIMCSKPRPTPAPDSRDVINGDANTCYFRLRSRRLCFGCQIITFHFNYN